MKKKLICLLTVVMFMVSGIVFADDAVLPVVADSNGVLLFNFLKTFNVDSKNNGTYVNWTPGTKASPKYVNWETYWKSKDTRLIHFIGKDNIVFHCIIFPAMLHAEGSYILPDNVPANEFLNLEGDKISTSRNWAVWLHEYLLDFKGKQDVLRYVLTANAPETKDNDFTWKDFQTKNNSELVAILGNFVNRSLVLTQKFFDGKVPELTELTDTDKQTIADIAAFPQKIASAIELFKFREALSEVMNLARLGNKYLADSEPWKLFATNPERVKTILNISLQICANLAIVMEPFLPFSSATLKKMLQFDVNNWYAAGSSTILAPGSKLNTGEMLFEKIEDDAIVAQVEKLNNTKEQNAMTETSVAPAKPDITYEDFAKLDIRTGTILTAERVPKTDKLLKLTVDTGIDKRTVVSGIAANYNPEKIIGQKVTILVNLQPKMLRGIQSQGMILMAENSKGELCFVQQEKDFENGAMVK